jgi:hypothetical protein
MKHAYPAVPKDNEWRKAEPWTWAQLEKYLSKHFAAVPKEEADDRHQTAPNYFSAGDNYTSTRGNSAK